MNRMFLLIISPIIPSAFSQLNGNKCFASKGCNGYFEISFVIGASDIVHIREGPSIRSSRFNEQ